MVLHVVPGQPLRRAVGIRPGSSKARQPCILNYMKQLRLKDGYILRFDKDEVLIAQLTKFAKDQRIKAAWFTALGAASGAELGYYNLESQQYQWHTVSKLSEITNLTGNIAWQNDQPVVHAHVTLTDETLKAYGGHIKELVVGGTCEVYLRILDKPLTRKFDKAVGLNLLAL